MSCPILASANSESRATISSASLVLSMLAKMRLSLRRISFAPVQRLHQLDTGAVTELVDIDVNLDDKLRQDFGDMEIRLSNCVL